MKYFATIILPSPAGVERRRPQSRHTGGVA